MKSLTWLDTVRSRARSEPDRLALEFSVDGVSVEAALTCGELDRRARAIGSALQARTAPGERAILAYPAGLDFVAAFLGCAYAGIVAVPIHPPHLGRPERFLSRFRAVRQDSAPVLALTLASELSATRALVDTTPEVEALEWMSTDTVDIDEASRWIAPVIGGQTLAFLQYTSGSTATPRGVQVSHGNLRHNLEFLASATGLDAEGTRGVTWLPPHHDMGLIGGLLAFLFVGRPVTILPPAAFLQHPIRWLRAISRVRATHCVAPPFGYDLCVGRVTAEDRFGLDLSRITAAVVGAEPIPPRTLEAFARAFEPCGFRKEAFLPCYGLAEATLIAAGSRGSRSPVVASFDPATLEPGASVRHVAEGAAGRTLVGCGWGLPDQRLLIVNPDSHVACLPGQVGEIWLSGPSVGLGYQGRPEDTAATFRASLARAPDTTFLRTGDLGFIESGELFVTGRLKDLIIVRGVNHYPQDLESTVQRSHPAAGQHAGAAFSIEVDGEERLAIVQEVDRQVRTHDMTGLFEAIRQALIEEHGVDVETIAAVAPGAIVRTSSGKVERHACRAALLAGRLKTFALWHAPSGQEPAEILGPAPSTEPTGAMSADDVATGAVASPPAPEIAAWLRSRIAGVLGVDPGRLDVSQPLARYGLDSKRALTLAADLEGWLGRSLPATLLYEYPTIEALSAHLSGEARAGHERATPRPPLSPHAEPIAIVGIGCRFPRAHGPRRFWQLLAGGEDAITEVPAGRWDLDVFTSAEAESPAWSLPRRGGFVEHVDEFDPAFFGISPREAAGMDPQQRLLLETAWEALEDAGLVPSTLAGSSTGVFVGVSASDYSHLQSGDASRIDEYTGTGNAHSIAANRLSYLLDLRGPSIAVDTACSSSLVAVHLACQSLRRGESSVALAGAVNLILSPLATITLAKAGVLSADGHCRTFDAGATGIVRSEGAGVVILKPLSRALSDRDRIYGVLRGSAINQDGRTNGLLAPSREAQEAVIREACRDAGVEPSRLQYVETHGTGTLLGDPIEARALGAVVSENRPAHEPCLVGSVKSNLGHLEAAAGMAGLIKVALSLHHRAIPPSLHFVTPNPHIPFGQLKLRVPTALGPWPVSADAPLAGVSSFGFGGTNAHVVVEAAPESPDELTPTPKTVTRSTQLLALSATSDVALRDLALQHAELARRGDEDSVSLTDVCYTAGSRRQHHEHRLAVVTESFDDLASSLDAFARGDIASGVIAGAVSTGRARPVVFVFPGQGSQWPEMGRELLERERVFRTAVEACDRAMGAWLPVPLVQELSAGAASSHLDDIGVVQPAIFAMEVGLARLWRSRGVEPDAVIGHSMGEVAAAHIAGILTLEDAASIVCRRSRLLSTLRGVGGMAAVELGRKDAERIVEEYPAESRSPR